MAVRELVRAAYARWVPVIGREPRPMTADYARAVVDHVIDLYEADGQVIALIEMVPESTCLLVENVAVLPAHQHRGVGDVLLRHAEACARARGLAELRLYTNAAFGSNLAFYARRGYIETRREALASGGELVHMTKPGPSSAGVEPA
jgi:N-acetylglutamate synthase-like GNAT family acetyltransferase